MNLDFLASIPAGKLLDALSPFQKEAALRSGRVLTSLEVAFVCFAVHGYDLLRQDAIRFPLFESLDDSMQRALLVVAGRSVASSQYENLLALMTIDWRSGSGSAIRIGRELGIPEEFLPIRSQANVATERIAPVSYPPPMHDYQSEVLSKIVGKLDGGSGAPFIVQLPTGAGKTRVMMEAVAHVLDKRDHSDQGGAVLWLAHTEELCEQAVEAFLKIWPASGQREVGVGRYWGRYAGKVNLPEISFVVCGFAKLVAGWGKEDCLFNKLAQEPLLVVVDEAHRSSSPSMAKILRGLGKKGVQVVGLTATPGRDLVDYSENDALSSLYQGDLVRSTLLGDKPIEELQSRGILSSCEHRVLASGCEVAVSPEQGWTSYGDFSSNLLGALARNERRNQMIVESVRTASESGKQVIVFCCGVEHAANLAMLIALAGVRAHAIHCKLRPEARRGAIDAFRNGELQVLLNYGVLSTGFDAPNINVVIIARPTMSVVLYSQMIGRGLRGPAMGGNDVCQVLDVKDNLDQFGDLDEIYGYFEGYWRQSE